MKIWSTGTAKRRRESRGGRCRGRHMALLGLSLLGLSLLTGTASAAGPTNDDIAHAKRLRGIFAGDLASTVGASKEPGEPKHAGNAGGASVWYVWTAPKTRMVEAETCDSSTTFNTLLAVYTSSGSVPPYSNLHGVTSNDNFTRNCPPRQSRVRFRAVAGKTYYIAIDGFRGATGHYFVFLYPGEPFGRYHSTTSQGKPISFRVTPNGRRIKGLRFGVRYSCRIRGRHRIVSATLRQQASDVIKVRKGNFKVTADESARGIELHLRVVGLFIDGVFDGRLRVRVTGPGVSCDTGPVRWEA